METNQKPHIAMYIGALRKGGAERVMVNLAQYFAGKGWKVTFVTTYFRPPEFVPKDAAWDPDTGVPYTEDEIAAKGLVNPIRRIYADPDATLLSGGRLHNFKVRYEMLRGIWKSIKPDVILSFIGLNNVMSILTTRRLHIPVVISVRADPAQEYAEKKTRIPAMLLFPKAAGIVLQTHDAARFFNKKIRRKVIILPNSINPAFIRPRFEGERQKEIAVVGRLDDNKAQDAAIRAFAQALGTCSDWSLHLYGDGPSRAEFEALADDLGIRKQVVFEGVQSNMADLIEKSSLFVLPSKTEGMPNALIEAMSLGLACISTDCPCGGPRDLIRDGQNGYLVPVGDTAAMADRMRALMRDEALRERIGKEAARIQKDLNPDRINGLWENYICSLIRSTS